MSINTKGAQDSDKFATIRLKSLRVKKMAVKGDEDGATPSRTTEQSVVEQPTAVKTTAASNANGTQTANKNEEFKCSWFFSGKGLLKILSYITVEPLMLCWLLPSCFLFIAVENLALEKSCRVNFNYSDVVCDNMIDKTINNINCVTVREKLKESSHQAIHLYSDRSQVLDDYTWKNGTPILPPNSNATIKFDITELEQLVCQAEVDSQKLDTKLNLITAPFDSVFGIIMILFAGGWSDKRGKRKPCMLIPLLGELAALIVYLIAAVFFKQLPLEFSAILGKLLPAITGGANLMLMGVYSYLSETTAEEDRTLRFGIFAQVVPLIPIASIPWSGILFQKLGYILLLLICIPINLLGVFYILFVMKEVKREKKEEIELTPGVDNLAFDNAERNIHVRETQNANGHREITLSVSEPKKKTNCLLDFFNPVVAVECIKVLMRKRVNRGRATVILLFVMYFIAIGPAFGEEPNEYNFTRIALNWDGITYSTYATYGNATSLVGTIIMVVLLSKLLKFSDPLLGVIGTSLSCVSRICYTFAETLVMMYFARTLDAFISIRALVIKSILSKFVDADELGRSFSIIAIIEAIGKFVFVSLYSVVYESTLENWPAAFYFVSFIFLVITAILFAVLYFIMKRKDKFDNAQKARTEAASKQADLGETTHM
ncbi:uncharacterized protein LOC129577699 isoform X2 [Sitodiplosis mosellana]|uniref:uncharacterized protein LOC129577699 isoform X2 n=1 Tax=Sitodiplosis mosellana TaxID=263140 RepID=UPI0024450BC3|nr:uncharacterized protein LOC129577699 isoform X2 [Sitodiplosis mosellana]